ncbi:hypothetical protein JTB14_028433 [Gonioctena quinquepunctata]|nr:hypothetical protein JTB14_028433 [Gonioctena quinquepunctata]
MPVKDHLEISISQIDELRSSFLADLTSKGSDEVDSRDVERVKSSDHLLRRFLLHNEGNHQMALSMLWTSLTWRKKLNVNDINESNVKMDIVCSGAFFPHGADIDGCTLLVFKCNKHSKGASDINELKRCIIYWFERVERLVKGTQITIFFDMEGCGLSNMDMELIKYLIGLFKEYYPYFLNYILIFEMPWVLTAAFKIVKSYFVPETFPEEEKVVTSSSNNRKVHFMDGSMSEVSASSVDNKETDGGSLKVTPPSIITFVKDGNELVSTLELQNVDGSTHISYKLKTTSPEKFRVKPSTGCLAPGESTTVTVTLLPGFQLGGLSRDKFLVMNTAIDPNETCNVDAAELWKNSSGRKVNQHRLKCIQSGDFTKNGNSAAQTSIMHESDQNNFAKLSAAVSQLSACQSELHDAVKKTQYFQLATLILVLFLCILMMYISRGNSREFPLEHSYCREANQP